MRGLVVEIVYFEAIPLWSTCISVVNRSVSVQTVLQTLIQSVGLPDAPNFAHLMMWAALANAIPVSTIGRAQASLAGDRELGSRSR